MKAWKPILSCLILILLAACAGTEIDNPDPTQPAISFQYFRDGSFQAVVPGWEESIELAPETLFMAHHENQFVAINRYPGIPQIIAAGFRSHISDDPGTYLVLEEVRGGKPFFEYTTREENQTSRVQVALDYCQGYTYAVAAGGRDTVENTDLFQQVLSSSSCQDPFSVPNLAIGKIGMRVNPAGNDFLEGYLPALRLAKENGVQVVHTYLQWGDIEPTERERTWDWYDFSLGYPYWEDFEISLVVNLIHTAVRGPLPEDLAHVDFDDPEFIARFTDFILEVLDRYPVQYLSIGNEVNDYFATRRDQIPAYQNFFLAVKDNIHQHYPEVKVGMTFAYHDGEKQNTLDIIDTLNLGDFLPITLYLYNEGFLFDRDPAELEAYLDRILESADGKPIAFAEIGWNTSDRLGGNEEDQADFVRKAFQLLSENRDQIEFLAWFELHDEILDNSYQTALTFLPENSPLAQDEAFMRNFVYYLNYNGLRKNDSSPKLGWVAFEEESRLYLEEFQE